MTEETLEFTVEGSSGSHYSVTFVRDGDRLAALCSCPAGEKRMHCKHRLALLAGDLSQARGENSAEKKERLAMMLRGSNLESALLQLVSAEAEAQAADRRLKSAKKQLDRVMHQ